MINNDECDLCETCVDMCPIEVMSLGEDDAGERIMINRDFCIGCGVCAVNCPPGDHYSEKNQRSDTGTISDGFIRGTGGLN